MKASKRLTFGTISVKSYKIGMELCRDKWVLLLVATFFHVYTGYIVLL